VLTSGLNGASDTEDKLKELINKGTMSDIEFIYRMINGPGQYQNGQNLVWTNALNRVTADIGFLQPTALGFQISPGNPDALSYVGWVESLSVTHDMFTEDMVPLNSTVTVVFNAFSRVGLTNKGMYQ
jgi:hypothetical protein